MSQRGRMGHIPESDLEGWAHHELRRLPDCQPPAGLVEGVLEQLKRRQAQSWWLQSLWQWPAFARWIVLTLFSGLSLTAVGIGTGLWMFYEIPAWSAQGWIAFLVNAWGGFQPFIQGPTRALAGLGGSGWLYVAGLFCALFYLLVLGIGTIFLRITKPAGECSLTENA